MIKFGLWVVGGLIPTGLAAAQCPQWSEDLHPSGASLFGGAEVGAMTSFDDGAGPRMALAGRFEQVGDVRARNVATWDGSNWSALGAGLDAQVRALASYDDGAGERLYAAGDFLNSGAAPMSRIARWDGVSWQPLDVGLNANAFALATFDDGNGEALYVAGEFTSAGGVPCQRIARWNGVWSAVGNPGSGAMRALEVYDLGSGPRLFAAGFNVVSAFDGAGWTILSSSISGAVRALRGFDDGSGPALYATGSFPTMSGVPALGIARWNGSAWQSVGGGLGVEGDSLGVHDDGGGPALYVGCYSTDSVRRWNGAGWTAAGTGPTGFTTAHFGRVLSIAEFDTGAAHELFIGGKFVRSGDRALWAIARLSGGDWQSPSAVGEAINGTVFTLLEADVGAGQHLIAGGSFTNAGAHAAQNVAQWDGAHWQTIGQGLDDTVFALAMHDDGQGEQLYAGGGELLAPGNEYIARWNGSTWSAVPGVNGAIAADNGVFGLASFPIAGSPRLFACGKFTVSQPGSIHSVRLAVWDGAQWQVIPTSVGASVFDLRVLEFGGATHLYATGSFGTIGGLNANGIARFDGAVWSSIDSGLNIDIDDSVYSVATHDDGSGEALYVSGSRLLPNSSRENFVARLDGSIWTQIGVWYSFAPVDLESYDDGLGRGLFASGRVNPGQPDSRLKVWRNGAWFDVAGVPTNDSFDSLNTMHVQRDALSPQGSLWIGGSETTIGTSTFGGISRYSNECACDASPYCSSGTTSSGCAPSISGVGRASASGASAFTIQLSDIEGARSGHVFYGTSGPHAAPWGQSSHLLCVKAPTQRTPTQTTGGTAGSCDGTLTLDWNSYLSAHATALGTPFSPGDTVWAQAYFRDPAGPKTTALSDGLRFVICP